MVDRYRVWLGAGVLAGGVSAAMLAGAGIATADDGSSAAKQASAGSDTADSEDSSKGQAQKPASGAAGDVADEDSDPSGEDPSEAADDSASAPDVDIDEDADLDDLDDLDDADPSDGDQSPGVGPEPSAPGQARESEPGHPASDATAQEVVETPAVVEELEDAPAQTAVDRPTPSSYVSGIDTDLSSDGGAMVMRLAAASNPWPTWTAPNLFDVIDDLYAGFYNWYTGAMQFIAGPARAPFGSRVRVESSDLTIGNGVVVRADWYFPRGSTPPKGLIYLQHGLWATSRFYSATAAYLAEKTHSIVVAPTLTWNPLDTENYPLMWPDTHRAIADLFTGDRVALNESAKQAGYRGALPTRVVLAGHSAGGGLVAGTARYLVQSGAGNNLAGVVMLDGVGVFGVLRSDLAKIPQSIPVYNLAAAPNSWNGNGYAQRKLNEVRPDMFTGVLVQGGHHSDSMQSTSGAVQFMAYLATGFSSQWNVAANELLSAGWINDMFDGTHTGRFYGANVSPMNLVAGSWLGPPAVVRVADAITQRASADAGCPADPALLNCTDRPAGVPAGRQRQVSSLRSA